VPFPFPHAGGALTLYDLLLSAGPSSSEWEAVAVESQECVEALFGLYHEALGRLVAIAVRVEEAFLAEAAAAS
jgi:hypothetical protein